MKHFRQSVKDIMKEYNLMYEQDLPEDITDEEYSKWFEKSTLMYGVRVGPKIEKYGRENIS